MAQDQAVDVHSTEASTQPCRLLGLPTELRLLIYSAYFGDKKVRRLYWDRKERNCWWHRRKNNGVYPLALLQTCREIRREAQPVLCEHTVPLLIDLRCVGKKDCRWAESAHTLDAEQMKFLEQVPAVVIDVTLENGRRRGWKTLHTILESISQGATIKCLTFILDRHSDRKVISKSGELTNAIYKLQCPSSAVTVLIENRRIGSERSWVTEEGYTIRESNSYHSIV
ncbi:hypothetical protein LTR17_015182 [Elasticomyces elasticus]|nr:hypothetical protein LTR17_015182 [Elasticomyces elasticus]